MSRPAPRLYLDQPLTPGQVLTLSEGQAHYLFAVMRLAPGAPVQVFNGRDGEWAATVAEVKKRAGLLTAQVQTAPQAMPPDLWLCFAPLKKARMDMVVEKAVELGAARLVPVLTDYTRGDRLRPDRLLAQVIEAAEQCGATALPQVADVVRLTTLLDRWPGDRALIWCDEGLAAQSGAAALPPAPAAILIGPEGGFSPAERARLANHPQARATRLGPRILRAETAAIAALALWQQTQGDWR
jgi:16S rRNA (uracil1498-N3)-methyltransferase